MSGTIAATPFNTAAGGQGRPPLKKDKSKPISGLVLLLIGKKAIALTVTATRKRKERKKSTTTRKKSKTSYLE
jgi:hypothetical protein